jgi:citrate synthase
MSDLLEEYPHLLKAFEEMKTHSDIKQEFETQLRKALSTKEENINKAAKSAAPIKEMETLLPLLSESYTKTSGDMSAAARKLLEKMPTSFASKV